MFNFNLFSVSRMLQRGYKLKGDAKSMSLEKGNHKFVFVSVICTRGGALYCARFQRNENPPPQEYDVASVVSNADASANAKKIFKINVKRAHKYLGHLSDDTNQIDCKVFGHESFAWIATCLQIMRNCKGKAKKCAKRDIWWE